MMDYMSEYPGPGEDAAIEYVVNHLKNDASVFEITTDLLTKMTKKELDLMGGASKLGSQAGWIAYSSKELVLRVRKQMASHSSI